MPSLMYVGHEVSEKEFFEAQKLAIKKSPFRLVRWIRWILPLIGLTTLVFLVYAIASQGFQANMIWGAILPFWMISMPLMTRRAQKKLYARSKHFHGPMSLDIDDYGMTVKGDGIDSRMAWSNFASFYEDDHSFVIYQSSAIFHPLPKRMMSAEQIAELRECFKRNIGKR
jgi:hypothetical protein